MRIEKDCFFSCLHLVGACFQTSSVLYQRRRFGERSWCHNVLDYMICAVECNQQRIGGRKGSVKEVVCTAQIELGLTPTLVAPYNQA